MAGKSDFTPEEWSLLVKSPLMAGLVVVAASPSGPIGVVKEMLAMGRLIAETKTKGGGNDLVEAIVADVTTREGMEQAKPTEIKGMSPDQARAYALEQCRKVAALVEQKAAAHAPSFKQWLLDVSRKVAEASKEGGFLGFGGTFVSEQETAALRDTAGALGVRV